MKVVITAAGHSRRFFEAEYALPKFLLPLSGKPMIQHVIEMFDSSDEFFVLFNESHQQEFPELANQVSNMASKVQVKFIASHEKGPVETVLAANLNFGEDPFIVSYCDFFVSWNYQRFLMESADSAASLAVFRGFHPASFGQTLYAYIKTQGDSLSFQEIREKLSFTSERHQEWASAGIYYFSSGHIFEKYAELTKLNLSEQQGLRELYVTLLFNRMHKDGHNISLFPVDKFICWGTPEDVSQYLKWSEYFERPKAPAIRSISPGINLIPMAGLGERFKKEGFRTPKPLIPIEQQPMFVRACNSFPLPRRWIFVMNESLAGNSILQQSLENFFYNYEVVQLSSPTEGQLMSCVAAQEKYGDFEPIYVASADYECIYEEKAWLEQIHSFPDIEVFVWVTQLQNQVVQSFKSFGYCRVNEQGQVLQITEKETISERPEKDLMMLGSFWFKSGRYLNQLATLAKQNNCKVNGEYYIGNALNLLIQKGIKVQIFKVDDWISFGNPLELSIYEYWHDFFAQQKNVAGKVQ